MAHPNVFPDHGKRLRRFERMSNAQLDSEDKAIALASDSDVGPGGCVWAKDAARDLRVADRADARQPFVDNIDWTGAALPVGGMQHSGGSRALGRVGMQEFINRKLVRSGRLAAPA